MKNLTDVELMQQVQDGQLRQVGPLYERHKQGLFAYFYKCSGEQMTSEDMVQEVFVKVIRHRSQFRQPGEFNHWLYRIARNTWFDYVKKKDPLYSSSDIETRSAAQTLVTIPRDADQELDQKEKLKKALAMIGSEKRDAIIMSRYQGLDYKTIASICECSESAIKTRVMRGLIEMKEIIKKEAWD